jgi:hypothetical protein
MCTNSSHDAFSHSCPVVGGSVVIRMKKDFWYDQEYWERFEGVRSPTNLSKVSASARLSTRRALIRSEGGYERALMEFLYANESTAPQRSSQYVVALFEDTCVC